MAHIDSERMRFEELLPFYINQTLGADDTAFMQQYLASHAHMQNEVSFAKALQSVVKETGANRADNAGLAELLDAYHLLQKRPSLIERIRLSCQSWGLTPAFAIAASVVVIQSILLTQYQLSSPEDQYRGLSNQVQIVPNLKITVNPQANFTELAVLLRQAGCRVVAGPSETGELWIVLDEPEKTEQIKRTLLDSGLLDDAVTTQANKGR